MKRLLPLLLFPALAFGCEESLPLEGAITVAGCDSSKLDCLLGEKATREYFEALPDDDSLLRIAIQSSPWRMYDGDLRIVTVADIAAIAKGVLAEEPVRRVVLFASWSGVAPAGGESLAARLSSALGDFPVERMDGFLWLDAQGKPRTTRQEYSVRSGTGFYQVEPGAEVFVPLVFGWASSVKDRILERHDHEAMLMAGVGDDVFMLCPEEALASFEKAAEFGSAVGAYNAALMRLDRGERDAAIALLRRAVALGDDKSDAMLVESAMTPSPSTPPSATSDAITRLLLTRTRRTVASAEKSIG